MGKIKGWSRRTEKVRFGNMRAIRYTYKIKDKVYF